MKKLILTLACLGFLSAAYATTPAVTGRFSASRVSVADSASLTDYVGKYKMEGLPFESITIGVKDGKLTIDTGSEAGALTPVKDAADKFDADGRATLKFNRDANKKVTGVTLDAQGMSFDGKKES